MTHAEALQRIRDANLQGPSHGNFKRVKELLDLAPDLIDAMNSIDPALVDETPQGAASHTQSKSILNLFLERGVRPDIFMHAALGDADAVSDLLRAQPKLIRSKGAHGIPLIAHAADAPTATVMISAGVECDIFLAAQLGLADHIRKLVNTDPELLSFHSPSGLTPLQIARMYQQKDAVKALLDLGAQDPGNAAGQFLAGSETRNADQNGQLFHTVMLAGASFRNINLAHATFENINLSGAALFNINLSNTRIDFCSIDGLVIMGIPVAPLIEAELKRRENP